MADFAEKENYTKYRIMMTQPEKSTCSQSFMSEPARKNRKEGESNGNSRKYFKQQPML